MTNAQWNECLKLSRLMVELRAIQKQIDDTVKTDELVYAHFLLQKKRKSAQIRYFLHCCGYRAPKSMPWVPFTDAEIQNWTANKLAGPSLASAFDTRPCLVKRKSTGAAGWSFPGRRGVLPEPGIPRLDS